MVIFGISKKSIFSGRTVIVEFPATERYSAVIVSSPERVRVDSSSRVMDEKSKTCSFAIVKDDLSLILIFSADMDTASSEITFASSEIKMLLKENGPSSSLNSHDEST